MSKTLAWLIVAVAGLVQTAAAQEGASVADGETEPVLTRRDVRIHDPSTIVRDGEDFWIFSTGTGVSSSRSQDLVRWKPGPRVFDPVPAWTQETIPRNRNGHFWAPDIIRLNDRFLLYYSVSSFGDNTSAIGLASNATLDPDDPAYAWEDEGLVIQSLEERDDFNAIDPALILDQTGRLWMPFGSFWGGIQMIELDPDTGKRVAPDSPIHNLADYPAIEAPSIHYRDGYYYLFVNWDRCCRGLESSYNIRVGRSESITGPYIDAGGQDMLDGGGTLLLGSEGDFIGPGHASIFPYEGADWLTVHFYDGATENGNSMLGMAQIEWGEDGWPRVVPLP